MTKSVRIHLFLLLAAIAAADRTISAQDPATDRAALRASIERRFDVLPLRDGLALRPRDASRGFRSIEVTDGPIAIDGEPVSGAELRSRLGPDADVVLELSYLSSDARRALFAASQPLMATPPPSLPDQPSPPDRPNRTERRSREDRSSDIVRFGRSIEIDEGDVIDGDVVAIGGSVRVDGDVRGDVVAVGGSVTLGPSAHVQENVVAVGGGLRRDPGARVDGRVSEIGLGGPLDLGDWRSGAGRSMWNWWGARFGSMFALLGTLSRLAINCLLAALVLLLGKQYSDRAGSLAIIEPLKAGGIGVLAQILFIPVLVITIVVLVITIVGIPLLILIPFALLGLAIVGVVGFTGVAEHVGMLVSQRFGWSSANPYSTTMLGILTLMSPMLLARLIGLLGGWMFPFTLGLGMIGMIVEYLAWTIGFGSVALMRFSRRQPILTVSPGPAVGG